MEAKIICRHIIACALVAASLTAMSQKARAEPFIGDCITDSGAEVKTLACKKVIAKARKDASDAVRAAQAAQPIQQAPRQYRAPANACEPFTPCAELAEARERALNRMAIMEMRRQENRAAFNAWAGAGPIGGY